MLYTEEQIQRANERSISDYFRHEGYSCKRYVPKLTLQASVAFM